jgi:hypothetical protein
VFRRDLFWGLFFFNIFMNDECNAINYSRYLLFAKNTDIYRAIKSPNDCNRLKSGIDSVQGWCSANFMKLNISITRVISFSRKTNTLIYDYKLCQSSFTRTDSIKDLGVFVDSKLRFHNHVDYIFSQCIKLLGLVRTLTFSFSYLDCLYMLYFTLIRSKLKYASVVWNYITTTDANKLKRIQQKFAALCHNRFLPHDHYSFAKALDYLKKSIPYVRGGIILMHCSLFKFKLVLNYFLPFWKLLVFKSILGISETFLCSISLHLKTDLLQGMHLLLMLSAGAFIYLKQILFPLVTFRNVFLFFFFTVGSC